MYYLININNPTLYLRLKRGNQSENRNFLVDIVNLELLISYPMCTPIDLRINAWSFNLSCPFRPKVWMHYGISKRKYLVELPEIEINQCVIPRFTTQVLISVLSRLLLSLESQLSGIPGVLLNPVHSSLLSEYIRRFNILPEGQVLLNRSIISRTKLCRKLDKRWIIGNLKKISLRVDFSFKFKFKLLN